MVITEQEFNEWKECAVTKQLLSVLKNEREQMKEGLIYDVYTSPEEVKGRCRAIATLLDIQYGDLQNG